MMSLKHSGCPYVDLRASGDPALELALELADDGLLLPLLQAAKSTDAAQTDARAGQAALLALVQCQGDAAMAVLCLGAECCANGGGAGGIPLSQDLPGTPSAHVQPVAHSWLCHMSGLAGRVRVNQLLVLGGRLNAKPGLSAAGALHVSVLWCDDG